MYNLFYIQEFNNGDSTIRQNLAFETRTAALSRYHLELAQVGISPILSSVTAMVFKDSCDIITKGKEILRTAANSSESE